MAASSSTTNTSEGGAKPSSLCPRGHWRPGEDEKLRQLVEKYGPQNWNSIAEKLEGRSEARAAVSGGSTSLTRGSTSGRSRRKRRSVC
uniref:Uncharacterized protein n=1 Tax=Aegilops tauschii subsp. strangulata TaxID=200361 RepID=A0A453HKM7_AEGTS